MWTSLNIQSRLPGEVYLKTKFQVDKCRKGVKSVFFPCVKMLPAINFDHEIYLRNFTVK